MNKAHEILMMIDKSQTVSSSKTRFLSRENYLKTSFEMIGLFQDIPEAITNSLMIAKRCSFMLEEKKPLLPKYATSANNKNEDELLNVLDVVLL